jgi:hypothetical protein
LLFPLKFEGECERGGGDPARASSACIGFVAGERDRCLERELDFDRRLEGEEIDVERETVAFVLIAGVRRWSGELGESSGTAL